MADDNEQTLLRLAASHNADSNGPGRQRAERQIGVTLREQAALLNLTYDAVFVRDLDRAIRYWNRGAEQMYGWTADEVLGKSAPELLKSILPVALEHIEAQVLSTGRWEGELVHRSKDGKQVVVASRWALQRDERGEPVAILVTNTDITQHKRAEQAREEIEELWRASFESNPTMYFIVDPHSNIRSVNRFGAEKLGYGVSELIGQPVLNVFYEPDRASVQENAERCFQQPGRTMRWEARKVRKDGTMLWVRETASAVVLKSAPVLLVVCEDITERKRAELALRESEQRYERVMAAAEAGFWDWDVAADRYYVSPRLLEIARLPPGMTIKTRAAIMEQLAWHPDDVRRYNDAVQALFQGSGDKLEMDVRLVFPDGTRWIHLNGICMRDASGAVVRWMGSQTDVTERKRAEVALRQSEERYARAMEASDAGHWDWNIVTDEIFVSDRACEMLALPAGPLPAWRADIMALVPQHPDDASEMPGRVKVSIRSGAHEREYRVIPRPGETRWLRSRGKVYKAEGGAALRMTGSLTDITESKLAADALRRAQRLEAMGTLAGGIAHDFNNILGAILGYGEMALRDAPKGSRLRRDLDSIMTAGERGRELVDRVLAFSRSAVGERVAVHVENVVREALDLISAKLPPNVTLHAKLHAGRAAMQGDATQVHQVLMNLVTNAIQAMPAGGIVRVSLDAARPDAARVPTIGTIGAADYLVLQVADTGTGIAPEIAERIFDPFFTTKEVGTGTGLGLSLVHGIVAEIGGAIDVASTPGKGSTFTVYLPRSGNAPDSSDEEELEMPRGDGQRVLVVDDEEPLVQLATRTLEQLGYSPTGFTSGVAALAAFRADPQRFDALITDERMPGMSGSALIREVRGIRDRLPIVLMSGFIGGAVASRAREAGAEEVLKKPLSARDLAVSLARVLQSTH